MDKKKLHIHVDAIPGSVSIEVKPNQVQYDKDSLYKLVIISFDSFLISSSLTAEIISPNKLLNIII